MVTRRLLLTLVSVSLGTVLAVPAHGTSNIFRTNHLTFSGPVGLPGVTLAGGTYIFERAVDTNADVVVVRSLDRARVYYLGSTQPTVRPAGLAADRVVTFSEPRRGAPPQIAAWYPQNETLGRAFVYPSQ
jgi:hypothetical protein